MFDNFCKLITFMSIQFIVKKKLRTITIFPSLCGFDNFLVVLQLTQLTYLVKI